MGRLEVVAQANLGRASAAAAPQRWAGWGADPALFARAVDYSHDDVELVIDLHRLILASSWLHLPAQPGRLGQERKLWVYIMPDGSAVDLRCGRSPRTVLGQQRRA